MIAFDKLARDITEIVFSATGQTVPRGGSLIKRRPRNFSADQWLRLIADLRLASLIIEGEVDGLTAQGVKLLAFLRASLVSRNQAAAQTAVSLSGWPLSPRKFAFAICSGGGWLRLRYFRDLDFSTSRYLARAAIHKLSSLGFFVGDIDCNDWRSFIVPPESVIARELNTTPEMHLVLVTPAENLRLSELFRCVSGSHPTLNECQFYGFVGSQFTIRTFVDVQFDTAEALTGLRPQAFHDKLSPLALYVSQLAEDAASDLVADRLGPNQAIELRALDDALRANGEKRPTALSSLIERFGAPWLAESAARSSIVRFVTEKVEQLIATR